MALIASEQSAFCNKTNNYISLNNHDICTLSLKNNEITMSTKYAYKTMPVTHEYSALTPHPYQYWTEKEIYEQKDSCLRAISLGGRLLSNNMVKLGGLEAHKLQLLQIDNFNFYSVVEHPISLECVARNILKIYATLIPLNLLMGQSLN